LISERLQELNIKLPSALPPAGNYLACVVINDMVHVGGHGPINGSQIIQGKVGRELSLEEGREAARATGLSIMATLLAEPGDLDGIERIIKIDKSFVNPTAPSEQNDLLRETIVSPGSKLKITMLAEGIETPRQLQRLRSLRCGLGQGYLFSRAVPRSETRALIQRSVDDQLSPMAP
jgi:enamine deaminase RidA (YjgF/YER057c/UK114 family)